jgi:hypothetical protein
MNRLDNSLLRHSLRLISDSLWWLFTPSIHSRLITILPLKHGETISLSTDSRRFQPGNRSGTRLSSTSRIDNIRAKKRSPLSPYVQIPRPALSRFQVSARIPRASVRSLSHHPSGVRLIEEVLARGRGVSMLRNEVTGFGLARELSLRYVLRWNHGQIFVGDGHDSTKYVRWQWLDRAEVRGTTGEHC